MTARTIRIALGAIAALTVPLVLAAGPAGAATRTPPPGYRIVRSATLPVPPNTRTQNNVSCPDGTVPWSGGVITESPNPTVDVADSFPDGSAWIASVNNPTASGTSFQIEVVCAKRPAGYTVVQGVGATLPALLQAGASAACPVGTRPLGGGLFTSSGNVTVALNSSGPQGGSWAVEEDNGTTVDWFDVPYAVCGKPKAYRVVTGAPFTIAAGSRLGSQATCPAPFVVVGGGIFTASPGIQANVAGTEPTGRPAWASFVANASAFPVTATPEAICAHA